MAHGRVGGLQVVGSGMTPDPSLPGTPMGEAEEEGSGRGLLMAHNGESSSSPRLRARSVMIAEEIRDEGEEAHLQRTSTSFSRQESSKLRGKSFMVQANHNKQIYEVRGSPPPPFQTSGENLIPFHP